MKHVQFRSQVKLNGLIKVEVYLLFEFPVGRVRGYRKFLNHEFLHSPKNYVNKRLALLDLLLTLLINNNPHTCIRNLHC